MIGKYPAKVDEKGRLFVPAKLREDLGEVFYVTIGTHGGNPCLTVYTKANWEKLNEKFSALPLAQQLGAASLIFNNAVECAPDKQYRFLLTSNLFDYAGITKDVMIAGSGAQAEIWDLASYRQYEKDALAAGNLYNVLESIRI